MKKCLLKYIIILTLFIYVKAIGQAAIFEETFEGASYFPTSGTAINKVSGIETFCTNKCPAEVQSTDCAWPLSTITSTAYQGSKSVRFEVQKTQPLEGSSCKVRSEVTIIQGDDARWGGSPDRWYSFACYFPTVGTATDPERDAINQWFEDGSDETTLRMDEGKAFLEGLPPSGSTMLRYDLFASSLTGAISVGSMNPIAKDTWQQFVFHIIHSTTGTGLIEVWRNGTLIHSITGRNMHLQFPKWKIGIYKSEAAASAELSRVMYFDNVRVGNSTATYAQMATVCPTSGTTTVNKYHFSTACGDDTRSPAQARNPVTPWRTLAKATSYFPSLVAGDSMVFNRGEIFQGSLNITKSGVTLASYGSGDYPVFTSMTTMSGWTTAGTNLWVSSVNSSLGSTVTTVTRNGGLIQLGRFPNANAANGGYLTYESHNGVSSITDNQLVASPNWTGSQMVVRTKHFVTEIRTIQSQSGGTLTPTVVFEITPEDNSGYFFQNALRTLDVEGEWYYDPSAKRIYLYSATTPTNIQASTGTDLLTSTNFSNVKIRNIAFKGANSRAIFISGGSGIDIQNCTFQYIQRAIFSDNHDALIVKFNTVSNALSDGIVPNAGDNFIITDNVVDSTMQWMGMGATSNGVGGHGIKERGNGAIIQRNRITHSGYSGIRFNGTNALVQYNFIDSFCNKQNDGGGIYSGAILPVNTGQVIADNIILNGIGAPLGASSNPNFTAGIYLDNNNSNNTVIRNTIYNTYWGIYCHRGNHNSILNNTTYNCSLTQLLISSDNGSDLVRNNIVRSNKFVASGASQRTATFETTNAVPFNDISLFFTTIDSNYYARPINDIIANNTSMRNDATNVSIASWKTAYASVNYDIHSNKSLKTITNVNQFAFHYNATSASVPVVLSGSWVDVANASYSGTITLLPYASRVLMSSAALITPVVTWNNPASITYPTALSATQLNATANVPGTFDYSPTPIGTVLNAGTQTLSVLFTPTNGAIYSQVTKTVTIVVNKATASITYSNLTQTYTGLPLAPTITTSPSGLTVLSTTYNGVGATPINAGVYAIVTGLTNQNYSAPTINGTFTINKSIATLTASNTTQTYNGTPRPITVVTNPSGLSGVNITYNGSPTAPTNAGVYTVIVTLTHTNYTATQLNTTLTILKATPTVTWSNPAAITYPTPLSGTQLNATASVAGTFAYTPTSGTVPNAGSQILSVNFTPTDGTNYNTVVNTTVTIVVNKATATLALSNTIQTYDGTGKAVTVTSTPAGLGVISVTYNGSATLPINASTYAVDASLCNSNYTAVNATGNLVINKAVATITITGLTKTYNGSQQGVTTTTVPAGLTVVSVTYNGSVTIPTNSNSYSVIASLSNANYTAEDASATLVINKATPVITWPNPSSITYPTPLSGTQLNATSNVAGSFVYVPPSGTVLNAGSQLLSTTFTPTDASNYNTVSNVVVPILVNKATATLTLSGLAQDYDGNPKSVTVTTNPIGLGVITVTYNGSATPPTAIGTYSVVATLTNSNYNAAGATGNLVISASATVVTITNLIQTYIGSPLPVTVTVVGGWPTDVTYNGSVTVPTNVATYTVIATINDGIHTGADTATYNIIKATPSITWANPANITFGTPLSGVQLNASSATAGVFTYLPPSGQILNAGSHILSVSFAPTDAANYNSTSKTATIVVNKATATITLGSLSQVYDGTRKSATATTVPAGLSVVTFTYNGSGISPIAVGNYGVVGTLSNSNYTATPATDTLRITSASAAITNSNLLQTYTGSPLAVSVTTNPSGLFYITRYNGSATVPTNAGSYTVISTLTGGTYVGADTATFVIQKATPTITWNNPISISYGTAIGATQLNAVSSVAGTFVYLPILGTVLNVGTQSLSTTFTPTDGANYNTAIKIVTITVSSATATLTLSGLTATYNGSPKPVTVTSTPAGLSGITITYNGSTIAPTNAGNYNVVASLVNDNYSASNVTGTLVIAKANPSLTWVNPTPIISGTALSSLQLNATANISGTFTYNPTFGAILSPGTRRIGATFFPTDLVNYNSVSITVPISVFGSPFLQYYLRHGLVKYIEIP